MRERPSARWGVAAVLAVAAGAGVGLDVGSAGARTWLAAHSLTTSVLVGVLMIAATYLVVERVLGERERQRWQEATEPLLRAIASAGAGTDLELRALTTGAGPDTTSQYEWLGELLARYQTALTGTPELIERWHVALSLLQHARAVQAGRPIVLDAAYEQAWGRFQEAFVDVWDAGAPVAAPATTWTMPAVGGGARR